MAAQPLFYIRGAVLLVKFPSDEKPGILIDKFALCLQEGRILDRRHGFVGVLLTSCKDNNEPRIPPWKVYVSPAGCGGAQFGAIIDCGQLYTFPNGNIIKFAYHIEPDKMSQVDRALLFGIGIEKIENYKRAFQNSDPAKDDAP